MTIKNEHNKINVPNLRFPEFQGEWEKCKLGELTTKVGSGSTPKGGNAVYTSVGHCFVRSQNVGMGYLILDDIAHIDDDIHKKHKATEINEDDVLLNITGASIGRTAIATKEIEGGNVNQHVCIIRANSKVSPKFLCNYIQTKKIQNYIQSLQTGGSREGLNFVQIRSFPISLPGIAEQSQIAQLLDKLNERIATQNKIIDKLQSLIKGIAQHCIRELINGWEYVRLSDICKITTGKLDANAQVENGQYSFFTCAEQPFKIDSYAFNTEALLISGNGANLGYINYYKGKFNAYQRTYVLDDFSVNIQYVKWALKVLLPQRIAIEKSSSNTPYIVLSTLADLKIPIPNNSKQNHIANLMLSFERKLTNQLALRDLYNKQKQYMLRQMFI